MKIAQLVLSTLAFLFSINIGRAAEIVAVTPGEYVGILEDFQNADLGWLKPHVRVLFVKKGLKWRALPTVLESKMSLVKAHVGYPDRVHWMVGYQGKALGTLDSVKTNRSNRCCDVGIQDLESQRGVPEVKAGKSWFKYQKSAQPAYRPLLLTSQKSIVDPEGWAPTKLTKTEKKRLLDQ